MRGLGEGLAAGSGTLDERLATLGSPTAKRVLADLLAAARKTAADERGRRASVSTRFACSRSTTRPAQGSVLVPLVIESSAAKRAIGGREHARQIPRSGGGSRWSGPGPS